MHYSFPLPKTAPQMTDIAGPPLHNAPAAGHLKLLLRPGERRGSSLLFAFCFQRLSTEQTRASVNPARPTHPLHCEWLCLSSPTKMPPPGQCKVPLQDHPPETSTEPESSVSRAMPQRRAA